MHGRLSATEEARNADQLLLTWERRSILAAIAHSRSANRCGAWDTRLGATSVVLTAMVGTSVFTALQKDLSTVARVMVGVLTVAAAVCSAVHVFAALPDRKAAYERAARRHAAVRRRIEAERAKLASLNQLSPAWNEIEEIKQEMDRVASSSPNASGRIFDKVRRQMKGEFTRFERVWSRARGLKLQPLATPSDEDGPRQVM